MANTVIGASVQIEFQSVGNMRKALKEANQELLAMQDRFGAASQQAIAAAKKVAQLKDKIEDAREAADLFDPGKKFQAFVTLGSQIAAGFSAVQGAMALVGSESEDVQKSLLKVQGAMALAQGLSQLKDIGKSFQQLKIFIKSAVQGLSTFQKALLTTGIGALVAAMGTVAAYWDDIKSSITGVNNDQEELNKKTEQNVKIEQEKLDALDSSDEILKSQGKSEKEILQLKMKQLEQIIIAQEEQIKQAKITKDAQVAAAKRNAEITKQIVRGGMEIATAAIRLLAAPIDAVISVVNKVSQKLGLGEAITFNLNEQITRLNESVANFAGNKLFDPKGVEEEGNKSIAELDKQLLASKNKFAGYQNQIKALDNKAREERSQKNKQADDRNAQRALEAQQVLFERSKSLKTSEDQELLELEKKYKEDKKKLELAGITDFLVLDESYEKEKAAVIEKYRKEERQKELEFRTQLAQLKFETEAVLMKEGRDKELAQLRFDYQKQLDEIKKNENYNGLQKLILRAAILKKQRLEEEALNEKFRQEDLQKEASKLLQDSSIQTESFDKRLKLIQDRKALENQIIFASEEEKNNFIKENEEATTKVLADQYNARVQLARSVGDALTALSDVIGKETAAGKALAIAQATINTFLGITEVWKSPAVLPEPFNTATKIAATLTTAAGGFAAVRNIAKTKVPGGGGPGPAPAPPPPSTLAPLTPAISPAVQGQALNAEAINNLGNTALRAYVMNSDIQNNDQRNAYLQRNARIG